MAIFKVPRITTAERIALVLQEAEIVFDTNTGNYYGGDNLTLGGYPVGRGVALTTQTFTLTNTNITNKYVVLTYTPANPASIILLPEGGIPQRYGIDFTLIGNQLSWNGLGLDNFLEVGETLTVSY